MSLPFSNLIAIGLLNLAFFWLIYERGKAYLMFFQQEEYHYSRFIIWWISKRAFDRLASGALLVAALLGIVDTVDKSDSFALFVFGIALAALGLGIYVSRLTLKSAKKPLVLTARAVRILLFFIGYGILLSIIAGYASLTLVFFDFNADLILYSLALIALLQAMPFILILADLSLKPLERKVKKAFLKQARDKLAVLSPTVIAITGSFGKTSTKQILNHILSSVAPTLATPGSVNTEMGITRIIREQLSKNHRYFIVEMGAYGPGSIERLCRLTPPSAGIITAVGNAHYERFKTLDAVAKAKFELAEACLKQAGPVVLSETGIAPNLRSERITALTKEYPSAHFILVGPDGVIQVEEIRQSAFGIEVVLSIPPLQDRPSASRSDISNNPREIITLRAPLFGAHQGENIACAAALANQLGIPWATIKAALTTAPQIRHRLEVIKAFGQPTILDDAYNSNPTGFAAALDVLGTLVKPDGKRILITPGMVELGTVHGEEHLRLGRLAAEKTDLICAVTPDRIPTFIEGITSVPNGAVLKMFQTQKEAEDFVRQSATERDAVLFENNLPDLYEQKVQF